MDLVPSLRFEKSMRRLDRKTRELVYKKLELFLQNKMHPSLRYKTVQALKHLRPPIKDFRYHEHPRHVAGVRRPCVLAQRGRTRYPALK